MNGNTGSTLDICLISAHVHVSLAQLYVTGRRRWLNVRHTSYGMTDAWIGEGMQKFAEKFYKGKAWQRTRAMIWSRDKGLCQDCLRQGLIVPAVEVHHIIELTPANIDRPEITLGADNLICLCKDCHAKRHHPFERRYAIGPTGRVEIRG